MRTLLSLPSHQSTSYSVFTSLAIPQPLLDCVIRCHALPHPSVVCGSSQVSAPPTVASTVDRVPAHSGRRLSNPIGTLVPGSEITTCVETCSKCSARLEMSTVVTLSLGNYERFCCGVDSEAMSCKSYGQALLRMSR